MAEESTKQTKLGPGRPRKKIDGVEYRAFGLRQLPQERAIAEFVYKAEYQNVTFNSLTDFYKAILNTFMYSEIVKLVAAGDDPDDFGIKDFPEIPGITRRGGPPRPKTIAKAKRIIGQGEAKLDTFRLDQPAGDRAAAEFVYEAKWKSTFPSITTFYRAILNEFCFKACRSLLQKGVKPEELGFKDFPELPPA
jgi:hypothetical protein